jgi:3-oxoacyl-[acyl-carrier protein] reductase|tara:strand:+ start:67 stop:792 length:726 start_codon:yes stop_codon:yes gene_type:complete
MNKTVFISGGSQGIGKAIAEKLAIENYHVIVGYKSNKIKAEEVVNRIKNSNGDAIAIYCDISERTSVKKVFNEIGNIDILINNAGIAQPKNFLDISDEDWSKMLSVNLQGAFRCSQEAIPGMIKNKWGRIINITSIGGQWGGVNQVHYASAKAGLIGLTMSLARIYSKSGITSNSISPGIIDTEMTSSINQSEKESHIEHIPSGRFGIPSEVAEAVSFLASNNSAYITGQTINVNGGMLRT